MSWHTVRPRSDPGVASASSRTRRSANAACSASCRVIVRFRGARCFLLSMVRLSQVPSFTQGERSGHRSTRFLARRLLGLRRLPFPVTGTRSQLNVPLAGLAVKHFSAEWRRSLDGRSRLGSHTVGETATCQLTYSAGAILQLNASAPSVPLSASRPTVRGQGFQSARTHVKRSLHCRAQRSTVAHR